MRWGRWKKGKCENEEAEKNNNKGWKRKGRYEGYRRGEMVEERKECVREDGKMGEEGV